MAGENCLWRLNRRVFVAVVYCFNIQYKRAAKYA